jgi:hypothetical protein
MADPPTDCDTMTMQVDPKPQGILHPTKTKRHGAAVVLATDEVKTSFTADFVFSTEKGATERLNVGNQHQLLFKHMLEAADDQTIRLLPTQPGSETKILGDLTLFPCIEREHRDFFHRSTYHDHDRNQIKIRVKHEMISKTPLVKIRNRIMQWLRANNIYLRSSAFDREDTVCFAWAWGANPQLAFRPTFDNELNARIAEIELNDDQVEELKRINGDNDMTLPKVFVAPRTQHYGNGSQRVSSNTLGICCLKRHSKLLKELTAAIDIGGPYKIIPQGLRQMASEKVYRKFLISNNDVQNNLRSIAVTGLIPQALNWDIETLEGGTMSMLDMFITEFKFYSVEKTLNTDINGRFLFVVVNANYDYARENLKTYFAEYFLQHPKAVNYDAYFQVSGPKLALAPMAGGVVQQSVDRLIAEMEEVEKTQGEFHDMPRQAWKNTATHIHFDLDDAETFPQLDSTKDTIQTAPETETPSIAPKSVASKSAMSADMSTIVSDMQSMISMQTKMMEEFMKQQAESFKQQQVITNQQITSLITLVTQMVPNNFGSPSPMYFPSLPPTRPMHTCNHHSQDTPQSNRLPCPPLHNRLAHHDTPTHHHSLNPLPSHTSADQAKSWTWKWRQHALLP